MSKKIQINGTYYGELLAQVELAGIVQRMNNRGQKCTYDSLLAKLEEADDIGENLEYWIEEFDNDAKEFLDDFLRVYDLLKVR